jgi:hypothetical protein
MHCEGFQRPTENVPARWQSASSGTVVFPAQIPDGPVRRPQARSPVNRLHSTSSRYPPERGQRRVAIPAFPACLLGARHKRRSEVESTSWAPSRAERAPSTAWVGESIRDAQLTQERSAEAQVLLDVQCGP